MKTELICLAISTLVFTACDVDSTHFEPEDGIVAQDPNPEFVIEDEFSEDPSLAPPKGPFDFTNPEPEPTSVACTGWPNGDWCLARCSNGGWYAVGHWTSIPYGNCTGSGQSFCGYYGMGHTGACWGHP
ncbi:hypothetical protein SAMN02745121_01410 [Nannocystis exedens]|uniref:Uncharacterized protein n=1 Tax=Nannocystis exedens TaxID=54 RepID=A0A1I1UYY0_9BACT|nr:hypothetical protein [Nannocystis exedens]PCC72201.1 hypothetical protein NAEX_05280 [Nannocystis exedens]SFD75849.1 hypothetical protein SAMN02745121_01410 [Nannocystis exedens]